MYMKSHSWSDRKQETGERHLGAENISATIPCSCFSEKVSSFLPFRRVSNSDAARNVTRRNVIRRNNRLMRGGVEGEREGRGWLAARERNERTGMRTREWGAYGETRGVSVKAETGGLGVPASCSLCNDATARPPARATLFHSTSSPRRRLPLPSRPLFLTPSFSLFLSRVLPSRNNEPRFSGAAENGRKVQSGGPAVNESAEQSEKPSIK